MRVNKLAISDMRSDDNEDNDDKDTVIAIDSPSIKITKSSSMDAR